MWGVYFSFQLRLDGYKWSYPFSIDTEGVMCISLKKDTGSDKANLRVEVRSGTKSSHYEVIFRPNSSSSPYRFNCIPILFSCNSYSICSFLFQLCNLEGFGEKKHTSSNKYLLA